MVEYKDWRGTPIEVGSIVVYPGRASSSMWMNEGEVVGLVERHLYPDGKAPAIRVRRTRGHYSEGISTLDRLDRVTVVG